MEFDFGIIGGGPAGYTAAINYAQKGYKVILFEKEFVGGTCLNKGCIPTKSLLHASEVYKQAAKLFEFGVDCEIKNFDFSKIKEKQYKTVEKIRKSLELAIKNSGVLIVNAEARALNENTILADKEYKVGKIVIATGAKPREIEPLKIDGKFVLSSDNVLALENLPQKVLIVGSGAIGIEWARIFSNFGVEVHIVELAEHLIPLADIEVSKRIERIFKQNKITFYTNSKIKSIEDKKVILDSGSIIEPDFILSAVGRVPLESDVEFCDVIGDARGEIQLAHYASHQAINLVESRELSLNKELVPSIIYGEPEIAWFGIREQECKEDVKKVTFPITALGKSWCDDATDGFIKILVKDDYIVGAHIVSKEASALLHQLLIAKQYNIKISDLKKVCFAHPTFSEGIFEAISRL